MRSPRFLAVTLLLAAVATATPALGKDSPRDKARLLTRTATVLARDGKYVEAVALYEQAYALDPDPILLFNLAVVKEKQGDWVGARDHLQRYLDAEKDRKLQEKGALRLGKVLAAIGTLRVEVDVAGAAVAVDGTLRGRSPLPPIDLAAGRHRVTVSRLGAAPQEREVEIRGREEVGAAFVLAPAEVATPPVAVEPAPPVAVEPALPLLSEPMVPESSPLVADAAAEPGSSLSTWGWVSVGVGAALLAGGATLTVLAAGDRAAVTDARRTDGVIIGVTQRRAAELEERANALTAGSWALYGLGSAAVVAGVTFLVWEGALDSYESPTSGGAAVFVVPTADGAVVGFGATF